MSHLIFRKKNPKIKKFVVVVSKAVAKKSTARNLLKRRIKAIVRGFFKNKQTNCDFMIIAKNGATALSYQELKKEIETGLNG